MLLTGETEGSQSGEDDVVLCCGHAELVASEYKNGNVDVALREEVRARKIRLEKNYVYIIVKTVELKQVSQGMYIEKVVINIQ